MSSKKTIEKKQKSMRSPMQKSLPVATGMRRNGLARTKTSGVAPDVHPAEVERIVRRRAPAPPSVPRTGPSKKSRITSDVPAGKVHQIVRDKAPTPPSVPRTGPSKTFRITLNVLAGKVHQIVRRRAPTPPSVPNTGPSKKSGITPDIPAGKVHQIVRDRAPTPPSVPSTGPSIKSRIPPDVLAAKVYQIVRNRAPAPPSVPRIGRLPKPGSRKTAKFILPHGPDLEPSGKSQWVSEYMEKYGFPELPQTAPPKKPAPPKARFRKLKPPPYPRSEYQTVFGPKFRTAEFDLRLHRQLHGTV